MEREKFKFNFFKTEEKQEYKNTDSGQNLKKKNKEDAKFKNNILAVVTACIGLAGMHFGIDYSGWLIFLGIIIHFNNN